MDYVLVTGITGRSGKWFYNSIIENPEVFINFNISVVVRNKEKFEAFAQDFDKIRCYIADIDNQDEIKKVFALGKITTFFHIAGISHSLDLVNTAVNYGVHRIILVHTTGIYSKYKAAGQKYREIETEIYKLIEGKEISLTILRPTMIYGTLDDQNIIKFIKMIDKFRIFPVVKGGKYALQPVHHKDLGKAYFKVLINPEKTKNKDYVLSGGTVIDLVDILKNISKFLNKKTRFFSTSFQLAYFLAVVVYVITITKIDYREKVQRLVEPRAYSHEEATKDFGYNPIDFLDGLKEEVDLYLYSKNNKVITNSQINKGNNL